MSLARIKERTEYFRDITVWPRQQELNVERWLDNFQQDEEDLANRLISHFTYFHRAGTDALLKQAIQNHLSQLWTDPKFGNPNEYLTSSSVAFVTCEGEIPHSTDSGNYFSRRLRDALRIPQDYIFSPQMAIEYSETFTHFIFIDDFVGSGNQFIDTITRVHKVDGKVIRFLDIARDPKYTVAYCPCVATHYAFIERIHVDYPAIKLCPAHLLGSQHNAAMHTSRIWHGLSPDEAIEEVNHLRLVSARAGYTSEDFGLNDWRGFHGLGLTLAFEHGIPDASLPIFYSDRNGWKPLMRRPQ